MLIADLIDVVARLDWKVAQIGSRRNLKRYFPEPIPRPGVDSGATRYGSEAIPVSEFDDWWKGGS